MNKFIIPIALALLCSGCAHKELKAPCGDKFASLGDIPCNQRQSVNLASLPARLVE